MIIGVILGVVGCVLPFVAGCVVELIEDRYSVRPIGGAAPLLACLLTLAMWWTALIVWLVMR
jgi:hypothetical protein